MRDIAEAKAGQSRQRRNQIGRSRIPVSSFIFRILYVADIGAMDAVDFETMSVDEFDAL